MSYANRGAGFEGLINRSNVMYKSKGIALIDKRPTPVKILNVGASGIVRGHIEKASTVDYDGIYRGRSVVFEAKSTKELNRFDLKNIQKHQYQHLELVDKHGGISFVLIEFMKHRTVYLLTFETLESYWHASHNGGRKSIAIDDFDVYAYEVKAGRVPVDYLKTVDKVWKGALA